MVSTIARFHCVRYVKKIHFSSYRQRNLEEKSKTNVFPFSDPSSRILIENPALPTFYPYGALTSCRKFEKSGNQSQSKYILGFWHNLQGKESYSITMSFTHFSHAPIEGGNRFGIWRPGGYFCRRPASIGKFLRRLASVFIMAFGVSKLHFPAPVSTGQLFQASRVHHFLASWNSMDKV